MAMLIMTRRQRVIAIQQAASSNHKHDFYHHPYLCFYPLQPTFPFQDLSIITFAIYLRKLPLRVTKHVVLPLTLELPFVVLLIPFRRFLICQDLHPVLSRMPFTRVLDVVWVKYHVLSTQAGCSRLTKGIDDSKGTVWLNVSVSRRRVPTSAWDASSMSTLSSWSIHISESSSLPVGRSLSDTNLRRLKRKSMLSPILTVRLKSLGACMYTFSTKVIWSLYERRGIRRALSMTAARSRMLSRCERPRTGGIGCMCLRR